MTGTPATEANWARVQRLGKYAGPRYRIDGPPPRRQWGMTPKQVAEFLKDPRVADSRSIGEASMYRRYAAGNESMAELADDLASGNEHALIFFIHGIELNILRDAAGFDLLGPAAAPAPPPSAADEEETYREAVAVDVEATTADVEDAADRKGNHKNSPVLGGMSIHNVPEQLF